MSLPTFQVRAIALMMEAVRTSETSVNLYQSSRRYSPEDSQLCTYIHSTVHGAVNTKVVTKKVQKVFPFISLVKTAVTFDSV
jgi:hypothetical protein